MSSLWHVNKAVMTGPYHIKKGEESQDRIVVDCVGDYAILIAADGAGSLVRSSEGAEVAVAEAHEYITDAIAGSIDLDEQLVSSAINAAREAIFEHDDPKQMGCTLAVVVSDGDKWVAGVVGDSFVVIKNETELLFVQEERKSEFANITALLTGKTISPALSSGTGVIAMGVSTDGLLHGTIEQGVPTPGFWNTVFAKVHSGELSLDDVLTHMDSLDLIDDDTTLGIATKGE